MTLLRTAALFVALGVLAPAAAHAQSKAPAPGKEELARGMKEAPALAQAAGARCTVTGAAYRGSAKSKQGKAIDVYETACQEGLGYIVIKTAGEAKPQAYDCLAAQTGGTACVLPANADPKAGLASLAQAAGRTCQVSNARFIGMSAASGMNFYELACGAAPGFRLGVPSTPGAKSETVDCLALVGTSQACTFTSKTQALAALQPLVQASGRTCQVTDGRFIGTSDQTHAAFYEVACAGGPGFVLASDTGTGKLQRAIDCAQAAGIGGGCTLTSATAIAAQESAVFGQGLAAAGFPCQISRTRRIGTDAQGRTVAEVACSNRPDGVIGLFPASGPAQLFDCVRAGALKQTCEFTSPTPVYAKYTAALAAKGRGTCKVSGARFLGIAGGGGDVVETACADGKPGWVIYFAPGNDTRVSQLYNCGQSSSAGHPCELPTNIAGNGRAGG